MLKQNIVYTWQVLVQSGSNPCDWYMHGPNQEDSVLTFVSLVFRYIIHAFSALEKKKNLNIGFYSDAI